MSDTPPSKMSIDISIHNVSILNALAAQLGEETVLQMAKAYITTVTERRRGIAPAEWQNKSVINLLVKRTMAATATNLAPLEEIVEIAATQGYIETDEFLDALSRLRALKAVIQEEAMLQ